MPFDPATGRTLPAGRALATLFQRFRSRIHAEAIASIRSGQHPSLAKYINPLAVAVQPVLFGFAQKGYRDAARRIELAAGSAGLHPGDRRTSRVGDGAARDERSRDSVAARPSVVGRARQNDYVASRRVDYVARSWGLRTQPSGFNRFFGPSFALKSPYLAEAVQQAALLFAQSTLDTIAGQLADIQNETRRSLRESTDRGEAIKTLSGRLVTLFGDPHKALQVASTEASRAVHAGELMAARESQVVGGKKWLASSDCCDRCRALMDLGAIPLDQPFIILPKGGPYAVVMTAPLHPSCQCTTVEVLTWEMAA